MCMEHDCDGNDHHISLLDLLVFPLNTRSCKAKGIALRKGGLLIAGSPDKCETPRGARNCEVEHAWPTQVGSCFSARPCQWPPSPPRWIGRCCRNLGAAIVRIVLNTRLFMCFNSRGSHKSSMSWVASTSRCKTKAQRRSTAPLLEPRLLLTALLCLHVAV